MSNGGFDQGLCDAEWDNHPNNPANQEPTEEGNMYCQECDQEFDFDFIFCPVCGERMKEVTV